MANKSGHKYIGADRKSLAIKAIREMTVNGQPPTVKHYMANRQGWMPGSSTIRNWFGCSWLDCCAIALETVEEVSDKELDRMAAGGEFTGIDKRLVKGWHYGCKLIKQERTAVPMRFWDTTQHRWIETRKYIGYMTV